MVKTLIEIFNGAYFLSVYESNAMTDDFFRSLMDPMIDLRHPLALLPKRMPWQEIEAFLAQRWALQAAKTNGIELKQTLKKARRLVTQSCSRKAVD